MRASLPLMPLPVAALALALVACNGDGNGNGGSLPSPTPAQERPRTVVSDDRRLTLKIPPGALDEEIEISITAVPADELPEELRVLQGAGEGYRLEPEGLEFRKAASVSLELDAAALEAQPDSGTAAYGLVSLTPDGERELLDQLVTETRLGEDSVFVRGRLKHFTWLGRTRGSLTVSLERADVDQPSGDTFSATADARNSNETGQVSLKGILGQFTALEGVSFEDISTDRGVPEGEDLPASVFLVPFDQPLGFDEGVAATGQFRCGSTGLGSYGVEVFAQSVVEVEGEERKTGLTVIVDAIIRCGG